MQNFGRMELCFTCSWVLVLGSVGTIEFCFFVIYLCLGWVVQLSMWKQVVLVAPCVFFRTTSCCCMQSSRVATRGMGCWHKKATTKGFEPSRAEPNGFRVHLLNHSDTLSWAVLCQWVGPHAVIKFVLFWMVHVIGCMFQLVDVWFVHCNAFQMRWRSNVPKRKGQTQNNQKMPWPRIELGTSRSSVWRSPNWAIAAMFVRMWIDVNFRQD